MTTEEKGFRRLLRLRGRELRLLSGSADAGKKFRALVNRIGAYAMTSVLGDDPRGHRIIEVPADACPEIASKAKIQDVENEEIYKVVNVGLDCPDYTKRFDLVQAGPKDT